MKNSSTRYIPYIILFSAVIFASFALFGNDSYSDLVLLRERLKAQSEHTSVLRSTVSDLRNQVHGFQDDNRFLERVARDDLGLVREDEILFVFEDEESELRQ